MALSMAFGWTIGPPWVGCSEAHDTGTTKPWIRPLKAVGGAWWRSSRPDIGALRPTVLVEPPLAEVGLVVTGATGLVDRRVPGTLRPARTSEPLAGWPALWWWVMARPASTAAPAITGVTPAMVASPVA